MGPKSTFSLLPESQAQTSSSFEQNSESVLSRFSGESSQNPSSDLTSAQKQVDDMMSHFVHEATEWKSLAAMMAGGVAFRLGKIGVIAGSEKIFGTAAARLFPLVQAASAAGGLATEVTVFEGAQRGLTALTDEAKLNPNLLKWNGKGGIKEGWLSSFVNFGTLKGFGKLAEGQNLLVQHAVQDMGMVLGHHVAHGVGLGEKPEGTLAEQLLHAEISNIQLAAGTELAHHLTGGNLMAFERGLDLTLQAKISKHEGTQHFPDSLLPQPLLAEGVDLSKEEVTAPKDPLEHPLLVLSTKDENTGESGAGDGKTPSAPPPPKAETYAEILRQREATLPAAAVDEVQNSLRKEWDEWNAQGSLDPAVRHRLSTLLPHYARLSLAHLGKETPQHLPFLQEVHEMSEIAYRAQTGEGLEAGDRAVWMRFLSHQPGREKAGMEGQSIEATTQALPGLDFQTTRLILGPVYERWESFLRQQTTSLRLNEVEKAQVIQRGLSLIHFYTSYLHARFKEKLQTATPEMLFQPEVFEQTLRDSRRHPYPVETLAIFDRFFREELGIDTAHFPEATRTAAATEISRGLSLHPLEARHYDVERPAPGETWAEYLKRLGVTYGQLRGADLGVAGGTIFNWGSQFHHGRICPPGEILDMLGVLTYLNATGPHGVDPYDAARLTLPEQLHHFLPNENGVIEIRYPALMDGIDYAHFGVGSLLYAFLRATDSSHDMDLARQWDVSAGTVAKYRRGTTQKMHVDNLEKLAESLIPAAVGAADREAMRVNNLNLLMFLRYRAFFDASMEVFDKDGHPLNHRPPHASRYRIQLIPHREGIRTLDNTRRIQFEREPFASAVNGTADLALKLLEARRAEFEMLGYDHLSMKEGDLSLSSLVSKLQNYRDRHGKFFDLLSRHEQNPGVVRPGEVQEMQSFYRDVFKFFEAVHLHARPQAQLQLGGVSIAYEIVPTTAEQPKGVKIEQNPLDPTQMRAYVVAGDLVENGRHLSPQTLGKLIQLRVIQTYLQEHYLSLPASAFEAQRVSLLQKYLKAKKIDVSPEEWKAFEEMEAKAGEWGSNTYDASTEAILHRLTRGRLAASSQERRQLQWEDDLKTYGARRKIEGNLLESMDDLLRHYLAQVLHPSLQFDPTKFDAAWEAVCTERGDALDPNTREHVLSFMKGLGLPTETFVGATPVLTPVSLAEASLKTYLERFRMLHPLQLAGRVIEDRTLMERVIDDRLTDHPALAPFRENILEALKKSITQYNERQPLLKVREITPKNLKDQESRIEGAQVALFESTLSRWRLSSAHRDKIEISRLLVHGAVGELKEIILRKEKPSRNQLDLALRKSSERLLLLGEEVNGKTMPEHRDFLERYLLEVQSQLQGLERLAALLPSFIASQHFESGLEHSGKIAEETVAIFKKHLQSALLDSRALTLQEVIFEVIGNRFDMYSAIREDVLRGFRAVYHHTLAHFKDSFDRFEENFELSASEALGDEKKPGHGDVLRFWSELLTLASHDMPDLKTSDDILQRVDDLENFLRFSQAVSPTSLSAKILETLERIEAMPKAPPSSGGAAPEGSKDLPPEKAPPPLKEGNVVDGNPPPSEGPSLAAGTLEERIAALPEIEKGFREPQELWPALPADLDRNLSHFTGPRESMALQVVKILFLQGGKHRQALEKALWRLDEKQHPFSVTALLKLYEQSRPELKEPHAALPAFDFESFERATKAEKEKFWELSIFNDDFDAEKMSAATLEDAKTAKDDLTREFFLLRAILIKECPSLNAILLPFDALVHMEKPPAAASVVESINRALKIFAYYFALGIPPHLLLPKLKEVVQEHYQRGRPFLQANVAAPHLDKNCPELSKISGAQADRYQELSRSKNPNDKNFYSAAESLKRFLENGISTTTNPEIVKSVEKLLSHASSILTLLAQPGVNPKFRKELTGILRMEKGKAIVIQVMRFYIEHRSEILKGLGMDPSSGTPPAAPPAPPATPPVSPTAAPAKAVSALEKIRALPEIQAALEKKEDPWKGVTDLALPRMPGFEEAAVVVDLLWSTGKHNNLSRLLWKFEPTKDDEGIRQSLQQIAEGLFEHYLRYRDELKSSRCEGTPFPMDSFHRETAEQTKDFWELREDVVLMRLNREEILGDVQKAPSLYEKGFNASRALLFDSPALLKIGAIASQLLGKDIKSDALEAIVRHQERAAALLLMGISPIPLLTTLKSLLLEDYKAARSQVLDRLDFNAVVLNFPEIKALPTGAEKDAWVKRLSESRELSDEILLNLKKMLDNYLRQLASPSGLNDEDLHHFTNALDVAEKIFQLLGQPGIDANFKEKVIKRINHVTAIMMKKHTGTPASVPNIFIHFYLEHRFEILKALGLEPATGALPATPAKPATSQDAIAALPEIQKGLAAPQKLWPSFLDGVKPSVEITGHEALLQVVKILYQQGGKHREAMEKVLWEFKDEPERAFLLLRGKLYDLYLQRREELKNPDGTLPPFDYAAFEKGVKAETDKHWELSLYQMADAEKAVQGYLEEGTGKEKHPFSLLKAVIAKETPSLHTFWALFHALTERTEKSPAIEATLQKVEQIFKTFSFYFAMGLPPHLLLPKLKEVLAAEYQKIRPEVQKANFIPYLSLKCPELLIISPEQNAQLDRMRQSRDEQDRQFHNMWAIIKSGLEEAILKLHADDFKKTVRDDLSFIQSIFTMLAQPGVKGALRKQLLDGFKKVARTKNDYTAAPHYIFRFYIERRAEILKMQGKDPAAGAPPAAPATPPASPASPVEPTKTDSLVERVRALPEIKAALEKKEDPWKNVTTAFDLFRAPGFEEAVVAAGLIWQSPGHRLALGRELWDAETPQKKEDLLSFMNRTADRILDFYLKRRGELKGTASEPPFSLVDFQRETEQGMKRFWELQEPVLKLSIASPEEMVGKLRSDLSPLARGEIGKTLILAGAPTLLKMGVLSREISEIPGWEPEEKELYLKLNDRHFQATALLIMGIPPQVLLPQFKTYLVQDYVRIRELYIQNTSFEEVLARLPEIKALPNGRLEFFKRLAASRDEGDKLIARSKEYLDDYIAKVGAETVPDEAMGKFLERINLAEQILQVMGDPKIDLRLKRKLEERRHKETERFVKETTVDLDWVSLRGIPNIYIHFYLEHRGEILKALGLDPAAGAPPATGGTPPPAPGTSTGAELKGVEDPWKQLTSFPIPRLEGMEEAAAMASHLWAAGGNHRGSLERLLWETSLDDAKSDAENVGELSKRLKDYYLGRKASLPPSYSEPVYDVKALEKEGKDVTRDFYELEIASASSFTQNLARNRRFLETAEAGENYLAVSLRVPPGGTTHLIFIKAAELQDIQQTWKRGETYELQEGTSFLAFSPETEIASQTPIHESEKAQIMLNALVTPTAHKITSLLSIYPKQGKSFYGKLQLRAAHLIRMGLSPTIVLGGFHRRILDTYKNLRVRQLGEIDFSYQLDLFDEFKAYQQNAFFSIQDWVQAGMGKDPFTRTIGPVSMNLQSTLSYFYTKGNVSKTEMERIEAMVNSAQKALHFITLAKLPEHLKDEFVNHLKGSSPEKVASIVSRFYLKHRQVILDGMKSVLPLSPTEKELSPLDQAGALPEITEGRPALTGAEAGREIQRYVTSKQIPDTLLDEFVNLTLTHFAGTKDVSIFEKAFLPELAKFYLKHREVLKALPDVELPDAHLRRLSLSTIDGDIRNKLLEEFPELALIDDAEVIQTTLAAKVDGVVPLSSPLAFEYPGTKVSLVMKLLFENERLFSKEVSERLQKEALLPSRVDWAISSVGADTLGAKTIGNRLLLDFYRKNRPFALKALAEKFGVGKVVATFPEISDVKRGDPQEFGMDHPALAPLAEFDASGRALALISRSPEHLKEIEKTLEPLSPGFGATPEQLKKKIEPVASQILQYYLKNREAILANSQQASRDKTPEEPWESRVLLDESLWENYRADLQRSASHDPGKKQYFLLVTDRKTGQIRDSQIDEATHALLQDRFAKNLPVVSEDGVELRKEDINKMFEMTPFSFAVDRLKAKLPAATLKLFAIARKHGNKTKDYSLDDSLHHILHHGASLAAMGADPAWVVSRVTEKVEELYRSKRASLLKGIAFHDLLKDLPELNPYRMQIHETKGPVSTGIPAIPALAGKLDPLSFYKPAHDIMAKLIQKSPAKKNEWIACLDDFKVTMVMVAMHSGRLWAELVPALETAKRRLNPNNAEGTLRELYNTAIVFYLDHRAEIIEAAGESLTPLGKLPAKAEAPAAPSPALSPMERVALLDEFKRGERPLKGRELGGAVQYSVGEKELPPALFDGLNQVIEACLPKEGLNPRNAEAFLDRYYPKLAEFYLKHREAIQQAPSITPLANPEAPITMETIPQDKKEWMEREFPETRLKEDRAFVESPRGAATRREYLSTKMSYFLSHLQNYKAAQADLAMMQHLSNAFINAGASPEGATAHDERVIMAVYRKQRGAMLKILAQKHGADKVVATFPEIREATFQDHLETPENTKIPLRRLPEFETAGKALNLLMAHPRLAKEMEKLLVSYAPAEGATNEKIKNLLTPLASRILNYYLEHAAEMAELKDPAAPPNVEALQEELKAANAAHWELQFVDTAEAVQNEYSRRKPLTDLDRQENTFLIEVNLGGGRIKEIYLPPHEYAQMQSAFSSRLSHKVPLAGEGFLEITSNMVLKATPFNAHKAMTRAVSTTLPTILIEQKRVLLSLAEVAKDLRAVEKSAQALQRAGALLMMGADPRIVRANTAREMQKIYEAHRKELIAKVPWIDSLEKLPEFSSIPADPAQKMTQLGDMTRTLQAFEAAIPDPVKRDKARQKNLRCLFIMELITQTNTPEKFTEPFYKLMDVATRDLKKLGKDPEKFLSLIHQTVAMFYLEHRQEILNDQKKDSDPPPGGTPPPAPPPSGDLSLKGPVEAAEAKVEVSLTDKLHPDLPPTLLPEFEQTAKALQILLRDPAHRKTALEILSQAPFPQRNATDGEVKKALSPLSDRILNYYSKNVADKTTLSETAGEPKPETETLEKKAEGFWELQYLHLEALDGYRRAFSNHLAVTSARTENAIFFEMKVPGDTVYVSAEAQGAQQIASAFAQGQQTVTIPYGNGGTVESHGIRKSHPYTHLFRLENILLTRLPRPITRLFYAQEGLAFHHRDLSVHTQLEDQLRRGAALLRIGAPLEWVVGEVSRQLVRVYEANRLRLLHKMDLIEEAKKLPEFSKEDLESVPQSKMSFSEGSAPYIRPPLEFVAHLRKKLNPSPEFMLEEARASTRALQIITSLPKHGEEHIIRLGKAMETERSRHTKKNEDTVRAIYRTSLIYYLDHRAEIRGEPTPPGEGPPRGGTPPPAPGANGRSGETYAPAHAGALPEAKADPILEIAKLPEPGQPLDFDQLSQTVASFPEIHAASGELLHRAKQALPVQAIHEYKVVGVALSLMGKDPTQAEILQKLTEEFPPLTPTTSAEDARKALKPFSEKVLAHYLKHRESIREAAGKEAEDPNTAMQVLEKATEGFWELEILSDENLSRLREASLETATSAPNSHYTALRFHNNGRSVADLSINGDFHAEVEKAKQSGKSLTFGNLTLPAKAILNSGPMNEFYVATYVILSLLPDKIFRMWTSAGSNVPHPTDPKSLFYQLDQAVLQGTALLLTGADAQWVVENVSRRFLKAYQEGRDGMLKIQGEWIDKLHGLFEQGQEAQLLPIARKMIPEADRNEIVKMTANPFQPLERKIHPSEMTRVKVHQALLEKMYTLVSAFSKRDLFLAEIVKRWETTKKRGQMKPAEAIFAAQQEAARLYLEYRNEIVAELKSGKPAIPIAALPNDPLNDLRAFPEFSAEEMKKVNGIRLNFSQRGLQAIQAHLQGFEYARKKLNPDPQYLLSETDHFARILQILTVLPDQGEKWVIGIAEAIKVRLKLQAGAPEGEKSLRELYQTAYEYYRNHRDEILAAQKAAEAASPAAGEPASAPNPAEQVRFEERFRSFFTHIGVANTPVAHMTTYTETALAVDRMMRRLPAEKQREKLIQALWEFDAPDPMGPEEKIEATARKIAERVASFETSRKDQLKPVAEEDAAVFTKAAWEKQREAETRRFWDLQLYKHDNTGTHNIHVTLVRTFGEEGPHYYYDWNGGDGPRHFAISPEHLREKTDQDFKDLKDLRRKPLTPYLLMDVALDHWFLSRPAFAMYHSMGGFKQHWNNLSSSDRKAEDLRLQQLEKDMKKAAFLLSMGIDPRYVLPTLERKIESGYAQHSSIALGRFQLYNNLFDLPEFSRVGGTTVSEKIRIILVAFQKRNAVRGGALLAEFDQIEHKIEGRKTREGIWEAQARFYLKNRQEMKFMWEGSGNP